MGISNKLAYVRRWGSRLPAGIDNPSSAVPTDEHGVTPFAGRKEDGGRECQRDTCASRIEFPAGVDTLDFPMSTVVIVLNRHFQS